MMWLCDRQDGYVANPLRGVQRTREMAARCEAPLFGRGLVALEPEIRHAHPSPLGDAAIGEVRELYCLRALHQGRHIRGILGDVSQERLPTLPERIAGRSRVRHLLPLCREVHP